MAYTNGTATSPTDLLQQLVTWLVSIGWTQDRSATEGSGWTATLHNGANYVHLRAAVNEQVWGAGNQANAYALNLYLGTAYNSGAVWNAQTTGAPIQAGGSHPVGACMQLSAGPFTNHYFFSDAGGDNIAVVAERTPGLYVHIGWGDSLIKAGSFTGGPYFFGSTAGFYAGFPGTNPTPGMFNTASCPGVAQDPIGGNCTFVRADVDSFTGKWIATGDNTTGSIGATGKTGASSVWGQSISVRQEIPTYAYSGSPPQFQFVQTSAQDGRANLLPVLLWTLRDSTTTGFSLLGSIPFVFSTNGVGNGFSNASEYPLGSDTYKLFPNFAVLKQ